MRTFVEFRTKYQKVHKALWKILDSLKVPHECLDCGKKLTPETAVILCDHKGFLLFCHKDAFHRMDVKIFWKRLLE